MIFGWLDARRRRRILEAPFPEGWTQILQRNMRHFQYLDSDERRRLCELIQLFVAEKHWEGLGGQELSDEIRVTIAGQACLLVLELQPVPYPNVETIYVYPSTFVPKRAPDPIFGHPGIVPALEPLDGEAHRQGPVILTWNSVRRSARHPERGHNVVFHEFAHKLDMLDGAVDGVPPLGSRAEYERWNEVMTAEYERLRSLADAGHDTFLDPYGGTDEAEFFAVVTEVFFDTPIDLAEEHPALYEVLAAFYRQDTAARARRARESG